MKFTLKKSDLNFKVYTVESKPTSAGADNDIAIISSVPMTNWIMSPEKPSGIPRNDGDVWIQYSTSGDTKNVLKQNALMIATISASQYVDGEWVSVEAMSYQGGEWVDWIVYLYKAGDECTNLTGGWVISGNVNKGSDAINITVNSSTRYADAYTTDKIDLTEIKSVLFLFTGYIYAGSGGTNVTAWVANSQLTKAGIDPETGAVKSFSPAEGNSGQLDTFDGYNLDVSDLSGEYYIGFHAGLGGNSGDTLTDAKLVSIKLVR